MAMYGLSDALVISEQRPRREVISWTMRWYSVLVSVGTNAIVAISCWSYAPKWTIAWTSVFWLYFVAKGVIRRNPRTSATYRSKGGQLARSFLLITCFTVFIAHIYLNTNYLSDGLVTDTLWLLYLPATFIMCQRGVTSFLAVSVAVASVALVGVTVAATPVVSTVFVLGTLAKVLWLFLFSFAVQLLVRYIGDGYSNVLLLHKIAQSISAVGSLKNDVDVINTLVERIARDFQFPHVFYFALDGRPSDSSAQLRCVAAACEAGKALASENFIVERPSVMWRAIELEASYLSNDVARDPDYYSHPTFSRTRAELAVPVRRRGRIVGVLDVQAQYRSAFLPQDVQVMEIAASHVARALDNRRMLRERESLNKITRGLTSRFLSRDQFEATLQEIADAAREHFRADIVVLFEHNPRSKDKGWAVVAGDVEGDGSMLLDVRPPDGLVQRLVTQGDDEYLHERVEDCPDQIFKPSIHHQIAEQQTFTERHGIRSRAVVRLRSADECLGVMFLNFKTRRQFDDDFRQLLGIFADLAALAVQKARRHEDHFQYQYEEFSFHLHDALMNTTLGVADLVAAVAEGRGTAERQHQNLADALDGLRQVRDNIDYFMQTWRALSSTDFSSMIHIAASMAEARGASVEVVCNGVDGQVPLSIGREVFLIMSEAIFNAVRRGRASRILVSYSVTAREVTASIADDGVGFDPAAVRARGLNHMRARAAWLGGDLDVQSAPGQGTSIVLVVPRTGMRGQAGETIEKATSPATVVHAA